MAANQSGALDLLVMKQNPDGGWGYQGGSSWTEPTAYAILALSTDPGKHEAAIRRGTERLQLLQRSDGGWRPRASVDESTWATALLLLLPETFLEESARQRAAKWLMEQTPANSTRVYRLRQWMLGNNIGEENAGWSWFPGTAAWVTPTSITLLALRRFKARNELPGLTERIDEGTRFLLSRSCSDGGWNHGSSRALGYDLPAYPETTGAALLASRGVRSPVVTKAVAAAEKQWAVCKSIEGRSWLRLGLMAQGRPDPANGEARLPCHTNLDLALSALADAAHRGRNAFLS